MQMHNSELDRSQDMEAWEHMNTQLVSDIGDYRKMRKMEQQTIVDETMTPTHSNYTSNQQLETASS